jgi:dTDP-4-amino-4,6-dideoxygalactose transaminase
MSEKIPYGKHFIDNPDIKSVVASLRGSLITTGPYVNLLEKKLTNILNVKNAIVCSSGTAALHLSFMAIGLKKGDNIIMPTINFAAAANISRLMGANIFLSDVDENTGVMTEKNFYDCIQKNRIKSLKAFLPMHLAGNAEISFDLNKIKKKYNAYCIEDACHALGSQIIVRNKKYEVGSCKNSDICTLSMHPLKSITSGEGGIITTNNSILAKKIKQLRSHGIERLPSNFIKSKNSTDGKGIKNIWYYQVQFPGLNYRLSDINCSLALSQLNKLKNFIIARRAIFKKYNAYFKKIKLLSIPKNNFQISACHLYPLKIAFNELKISKTNLMTKLLKKGVITQVHYIPLYYHPAFSDLKKKWFKGTEKYYNNSISLPIFFKLTNVQIKYICKLIHNIVLKNKLKNVPE